MLVAFVYSIANLLCAFFFCSQEDDFNSSDEDNAGYGSPSSVSTLALPITNT